MWRCRNRRAGSRERSGSGQVSSMRVERLIVGGVAATLFAFAVCYALWRKAAVGSVDWAGVIMLGSGGALCAVKELRLSAAASMMRRRSGTGGEAQRADAGRALGPSGYWPIAVTVAVTALAFVHQARWLIATGVAAVLLTVSGLTSHHSAGAHTH